MLFDVIGLADHAAANAVAHAVEALDPQARITVDLDRGRLLTEGLFGEAQVIQALRSAGYACSVAPEHPAGSTCCGSCG
ncbi:hypothetical protein [Cognatiluteimonas weifangensis]|uniref:Heavy-metal-associated domain-containing protein n=1 Tax=Cognatiluteimonas weifangensis TaxID=2303539 RepID=A0A372DNG5_9GAMM|nr:hypothetical protein [Luteimonas weifangensis]RFP61066.1 hypothetical protein D0Y53_04820 [Luteimonas weifangensis]